MKNIIFALLIPLNFLFSCRDGETPCDEEKVDIVLNFAPESMTRAFFDDTAEAESWEKAIKSASIFVFDPSGKLVCRKNLNQSDLSAGQTVFSVDSDILGKECSFYAVANESLSSGIDTRDKLLSCEDIHASRYNGTAEQVMSGCARPEGFIMTGMTIKTISPYGSTTYASISLKRSVAKIAFRYRIDDEFYNTFKGSSLKIDLATIQYVSQYSMMFEDSCLSGTINQNYSHQQVPLGNDALFYIYPQKDLQSESPSYVTILLEGIFDKDGDFATTGDQTKVQYQIPVMGSGKGEIKRNGYYRIETSIKGITGQDASALLTAAEWEAPYTQFDEVGK